MGITLSCKIRQRSYHKAMDPTFDYERKLWERGLRFVGGADEVGRGAFAGPVVAAVVVFDPLNINWPKDVIIRDSKKMTPRAREIASLWIKQNSYWGIGEVGVKTINKIGMGKATKRAFRQAIAEVHYHLPKRLDHLLVDAFFVPYAKGLSKLRQTAIVKGDEVSFSIAAASIVAKVYRDGIMNKLGREAKYKKYRWFQNAGYGTEEHRKAILAYGKTIHHRTDYLVKLFASRGL